jgi:hypothetical protein
VAQVPISSADHNGTSERSALLRTSPTTSSHALNEQNLLENIRSPPCTVNLRDMIATHLRPPQNPPPGVRTTLCGPMVSYWPLCVTKHELRGRPKLCQGETLDDGNAPRFITYTPQNLAQFVRTHEKALANALQLRRQTPKNGHGATTGGALPRQASSTQSLSSRTSTPSTIAAVLSLGTIHFTSQSAKAVKLSLTPHHLYYLLCKIEESGIPIGPMNIRVESIHAEASPANYVSFLTQSQRSTGRSDRASIHSVSSVRGAMSSMSSLWSSLGIGSRANGVKNEKTNVQFLADLKYLYSAFTKVPCLRLSPDYIAHLISGYEEFPFDTAVPLHAFKNVSVLEISDVDFRQFYGWDRLADQLRSITVKRANLNDPSELLTNIVLDDMDRRRRRSSKAQSSPNLPWPSSPSMRFNDMARANSTPSSPMKEDRLSQSASPRAMLRFPDHELPSQTRRPRTKSASPTRPDSNSAPDGPHRHMHTAIPKVKRSGSTSSNSSSHSSGPLRSGSSSNLLSTVLPVSKWRFLRHLSLPDNSLTSLNPSSLAPLVDTLHSLDLSSNLFNEVPDCLASLTALRALNLSNCMIESLHSLIKNPVPAVTALNLRANRLTSLSGVERMLSLERLDLRENRISDPTELARLTGTPDIHEVWVVRNPFTRTHGNYRITIFNLFRSTPGYAEDIVIDYTGPSYAERRHLRDRLPETEQLPVKPRSFNVEPNTLTNDAHKALESTHAKDQIADTRFFQRPEPQVSQSEIIVGSARRKKASRRRIVDLAQDQPPPILHQMHLEKSSNSFGKSGTLTDVVAPLANGTPSPLPPFHNREDQVRSNSALSEFSQAKGSTSDISSRGKSLVREIQSLSLNGEAYKSKVEALKEEVGSNWLSALSDQVWIGQKKADGTVGPLPQHDRISISPPLRAQSQTIVGSART